MYYYVYRITNRVLNKHYYGFRSSKIEPKLDLGLKYFSSSRDNEFLKDQRENFNNYKYKIIKTFKDKKSAVRFESKLHFKFDVRNNDNFYNRSNQTLDSFLTQNGSVYTQNFGWVTSEEYQRNKEKYKIHKRSNLRVLNVLTNKEEVISYELYRSNKKDYHHLSKRKVVCLDKLTNTRVQIDTKLFYTNPGRYVSISKGKVACYNIRTGEKGLVPTEEYKKDINLQHGSKNRVSVYDLEDQKSKSITSEEYYSNRKRYQGVNKNKISGKNNPNRKLIYIYNPKETIMYKCEGNFKNICIQNNLPFSRLGETYRNNSKIEVGSRSTALTKEYEGWFARVIH